MDNRKEALEQKKCTEYVPIASWVWGMQPCLVWSLKTVYWWR
jgi:hypothetical protein